MSGDAARRAVSEEHRPTGDAPRVLRVVPKGAEFRCVACGYKIRGLRIEENCPECGTPVIRSASVSTPTSGWAIASLVLGILGVMGCATHGVGSLVLGPIAVWASFRANAALRRGEAGGSTRGMATAGIVLGAVSIVLGLVGVAFLLMLLLRVP